jgi:hypothetical protein
MGDVPNPAETGFARVAKVGCYPWGGASSLLRGEEEGEMGEGGTERRGRGAAIRM